MSDTEHSEDTHGSRRRRPGHHGHTKRAQHHHRHHYNPLRHNTTDSEMEERMITLYDVPTAALEDNAWSPDTWRARLALNFKGLQYRTVWLQLPDVVQTFERLSGLSASPHPLPSSTLVTPDTAQDDLKSTSTSTYPLPLLYDPTTGKTVASSFAIALYLDEVYPAPAQLFHPDSLAVQLRFDQMFAVRVFEKDAAMESDLSDGPADPLVGLIALERLMAPLAYAGLNGPSKHPFRTLCECRFGVPLEDASPVEKRARMWERVKEWLGEVLREGILDGWDEEGRQGEALVVEDVQGPCPDCYPDTSPTPSTLAPTSGGGCDGVLARALASLSPRSTPALTPSTSPTSSPRSSSSPSGSPSATPTPALTSQSAAPKLTYTHLTLLATLLYIRRLAKPHEWEAVERWHGGRWYRFFHALRARGLIVVDGGRGIVEK